MTLLRRIWAWMAGYMHWHLRNPPGGLGVLDRPRENLKPKQPDYRAD